MLRAVALGAGWCLLCAAALLLADRRLEEIRVLCLVLLAEVWEECVFSRAELFFSFEEVFFFGFFDVAL